MTHLNYDPDAALALPVSTFNGIKIGFMGTYDLGCPPMDDDWIIAEGHHEDGVFLQAANDLHESERYGRPFDAKAVITKVWAINLARCDDLYECPNKICQRWGSWQIYADWFAMWHDGDEDFTAFTPGAMPVTLLDPRDWSEAFTEAAIEADRKYREENPPLVV